MKAHQLTLLLLLSRFTTMAQVCPSNRGQVEVAVSYGSVSPRQIQADPYSTITATTGATGVSVRYFRYSVLAFGLSGCILTEKGQTEDVFNKPAIKSTYTQRIVTIALEIYYVYGFRKYFEAYTFLGAGPAFAEITTDINAKGSAKAYTTQQSTNSIKMQYTPIGVRVGGRIGGFAELGFGYKGLINLGITYKLGGPCWWNY